MTYSIGLLRFFLYQSSTHKVIWEENPKYVFIYRVQRMNPTTQKGATEPVCSRVWPEL
jgi:hypothetical protein